MAIYDNNGTTSYEIGKLYDNDGTASHQIGKVYDNDGTTNYLIYSAENFIVENGVEMMSCTAQRYTADVTRTLNNGYVTVKATNGAWEGTLVQADGCYRLTDKLDLTNIKTITLTVSTAISGGNANFYVTQRRADMYSSYANSSYCPAIKAVSAAGEYVLDVSSLSGEYWVGVQIKCTGGYNGMSATVSISDWKFE